MKTKMKWKTNNNLLKTLETNEAKLVRVIQRKERNKEERRATTLLEVLAVGSETKLVNLQKKKESLRI